MLFVLASYIALIGSPGTPDVGFWLRWIDLMRTHGVIGGYAIAGSDYLPGAFAVLAASSWVGDALGIGALMALKITIAAFALAGALIYWWWERNLWHVTAFSLALLINSAAHAYLDAFYLPALLLMVWTLQRDRALLAGLCLGIALCFKWQPLIVAPFVFVYACRSWPTAARLALGIALPIACEIAIAGFQPIAQSLARATSHHALSNQALNINWIAQMAIHDARGLTVPLFLTPLPRPLLRVTQVAFLIGYATTIVALWRRGRGRSFEEFLWCTFAGTLVYFSLNAGVHENHLFVTMVLAFCLLLTKTNRARVACVFCAVSANINLLLFYGLTGRGAPLDATLTNTVSIVIALINTAFLVWCLRETVAARTGPSFEAE